MRLNRSVLSLLSGVWFIGCSDVALPPTSLSNTKKPERVATQIPPFKGRPANFAFDVLAPGTGELKSAGQNRLYVAFVGKLDDGTVFDSATADKPFVFILGNGDVHRGWDKGLMDMRIGEKRRLTVPPDMGYGEKGKPPTIPPHANLTYEVELLKIE
jgi:FKBP-type peptidyl-prolyl cis-trans isomerase